MKKNKEDCMKGRGLGKGVAAKHAPQQKNKFDFSFTFTLSRVC
jgi:hypothetical protein